MFSLFKKLINKLNLSISLSLHKMNLDCLFTTLLYCNIKTISLCLSSNKINITLNKELFWKLLSKSHYHTNKDPTIKLWLTHYKLCHLSHELTKAGGSHNAYHEPKKGKILFKIYDLDINNKLLTTFKFIRYYIN